MIVVSPTGQVRRICTGIGSYTFPIGENIESADYSPITVNVTAGTFSSASIGVTVVDAIHPNNNSPSNNISRYWNVTQSGITNAVASISATYISGDIIGTEASIAAAELNGTFNQQTNPWIKFVMLGSNTLTATGAVLTAGQTAAFTGIKGAVFTAPIIGYGAFCQNETVTFTAPPISGDGPFTYSWSNGLGSQSTASPSTAAIGTTGYSVTVQDSNGIAATDAVTVTVLAPTVAGTISSNQSVCSDLQPNDLTLSGYIGSILYWQSAADSSFTNPVNIANTTNTLTGATIGSVLTTSYYRAVVQNGSCSQLYSSYVTISIGSNSTWNGTVWSNGAPTSTTAAVISANFVSTGTSINACSLTVTNNAVVTISSGDTVTLNGNLTVGAGSSVTFNSNANLIQGGVTNANSGAVIIKRKSAPLKRLDYTLWSSPVANQNLLAFSPNTLVNRFYNYNTNTNFYNAIADPATTSFEAAKGYLIRTPNDHAITPTIWNGEFIGVPNNGNYSYGIVDYGIGKRFNLVGNPYPSPIDANNFVSDTNNSSTTSGTLYFWRKTNNPLSPSYCTWSTLGFTSNGEVQVTNPNNVIQTGQGFFIEATGNGTNVNFTNAMRIDNHANQFFRTTSSIEKSCIWLNASNSTGSFSQTLVGYMTGATAGVDAKSDGKYINDGAIALTTLIGTTPYAIQGRGLPFDSTDVVPLHFRTSTAGDYTIAIDHVDGLFLNNQLVYLRDNTTGMINNLSTASYSFAAEAGVFENRFELVYQSALGITIPHFNENQIVIYKNKTNEFIVNTGTTMMATVKVFDIRGRLLQEQKAINAMQTTINCDLTNEVLLVQITSTVGVTVTKKIVNY